jgi:hypothetical protein
MTRSIFRPLAVCTLAIAAAGPALAASDLTGQSVNVDWVYGNPPAPIAHRAVTVGAGAEITCAGGTVGPDLCGYFLDGASIDVGANTLTLTIDSGDSSWTASDYNGYRFSNLSSGGTWGGYVLSTNFAGVDDSLVTFTPDAVSINLQGIQPVAGQSFTITLLSAVPEPGGPALLLAGLGVLACIARRRVGPAQG